MLKERPNSLKNNLEFLGSLTALSDKTRIFNDLHDDTHKPRRMFIVQIFKTLK
jgi:hypothetical protein